MKVRAATIASILGVFVCFGTSACSSDHASAPTTKVDPQLEVIDWWVNPGETDAMSALITMYQGKYPQTKVINSATDPAEALHRITDRMTSSSPPDTFQTLGAWNLWEWVAYNGQDVSQSKMEPLDFVAKATNLYGALPPSVLDVESYSGSVYAIPIGIHRFNMMYYSKKLLADRGLTPPATLADLYTLCDTLKAQGMQYPIALGTTYGQALTMVLWDSIFVGMYGVDFHESFFGGKEDPTNPDTAAKLANALKELNRILDYSNPDRDSLGFTSSDQMVIDGKAALTLTGDFAKGYFLSQGWHADVELGGAPTPGSNGAFTYVVDSFGLPKGALDRDSAVEFLTMLATPATQEVFGPIKGATPPRTDIDPSKFDSLGQQNIRDFKAGPLARSTELISKSLAFSNDLDTAMKQFSMDRDAQAVINIITNRYDELK
jgi:glucose/mannose transport system substrate-binding protein